MATIAMQTADAENTPIEVTAPSSTGCGTHTRFCDDNEQAEKVLADISNRDIIAKEAAKEQLQVEAVPAEEAEVEAEEEAEAKEEEVQEAEEQGEEGAEETDPKMQYRSGPSHFYPESKTRSTEFCGTHKRFEDDEAEAAPLTAEEKAAMDALATNMGGAAMVLDTKEAEKPQEDTKEAAGAVPH
eukprot:CAMPEP_0173383390 /NCGR_PEP_ID=MMETSP1356-20130122/5957_1 /TAXON_ID=77927 ORGANISM="Hemiselmis virescens, Strain PCC157" /NCGR_SAMPLE_ID=MMETSP1356 /ASSEMBLY_ACC=CAM_ASM_000847 /LENGTH=184 /DNA_ID=CAMNT_0014338231 /DNA_START=30 /DNA_END=584 /DNA_ORIENTATION=-